MGVDSMSLIGHHPGGSHPHPMRVSVHRGLIGHPEIVVASVVGARIERGG